MPTDEATSFRHNQPPPETLLVPLDDLTVWAPAANLAADVPEDEQASELEIYEEGGQRQKPIARYRVDRSLEIVANANILDVARAYCDKHPNAERTIKVEIRDLSDQQAFHRLALDVERPTASALAQGRFFTVAVATFGGVSEAARACRVSKAAVSKNLAVARCGLLLEKVAIDPRNISQRNATWLVQKVDAKDEAQAQLARAMIDRLSPGTVAAVFRELRRAMPGNPKVSKTRRPLAIAGHEVGEVRFSKGRIVSISFENAGEMPPKQIASAVQRAFEDARNQAN